ncbi:MAG: efflux RND transporter periplasmic adaptor subunit [Desulfobacterales bacterium]|nr:efflux RND transporter periplasmic adaptor subunit [Desulfobacterales bacterium]
MKNNKKIVIPLVVIAILGGFYFFKLHKERLPKSLIISGNIEVTEVQLGFKVPGRLELRVFDEGDTVSAGQVVAKLDPVDQKLSISRAKANLAQAEAFLAELMAGSREEDIKKAQARVMQAKYSLDDLKKGSRTQEISDAQAELDRAIASSKGATIQFEQAKSDYDRFNALYKQGGVSMRDFELYRTKYETAQNLVIESEERVKSAKARLSLRMEGARAEEIKKAKAYLEQAEAEYSLVKTGPRKETIDQAKAQVDAAKESLKQAEQQLKYTELITPIDGVVLSKSAESGEYLNIGLPVLTIGDMKRPWLRAYISEKDIGRIKLGDSAIVTTDSLPGKVYNGRISFINSQAEFTPKAVQTFEERVKLMYRIKITLDNPKGELKPGMPADARIKAEG